MRSPLLKFFLIIMPFMLVFLGVLYYTGTLSDVFHLQIFTPPLETQQTIQSLAHRYHGDLSRPLIPEESLGLPLWLHGVLSIGVVFGMIFIALFFRESRGLVMLVTVLTIARHLLWRGLETIDTTSPIVAVPSLVIYGAELLAFVSLLLGFFQVIKPLERKPIDIANIPDEKLPTVDVMVCTYNEPIGVVYRTLVGCLNIDYPRKTVYLLDDGKRAEMAELARKLGAKYITRDKNTHAKAGNLNNALKYSDGELVLVFDADHVACRNFLEEVVGFFRDDKMAYVQTPQNFFTPDPFQRNLALEKNLSNEQDYFFHVIQPGNDGWGAAFFAGSGAVFRRKALQETNGFAVETITEDVHTGLRLHAKGWKSAYYKKDLAVGLSTDNFSDFVKQRERWSRGLTQILCIDNPLITRGLTLAQRICYFSGIWYFFHGLPRIIFLIAPLFFLLFGIKTINAGFVEILVYYLPSFVCLFLGFSVISRGLRQSFWAEVYETALCFYLFWSTSLTLISPREAKFRVTPKGTMAEALTFNWQVVFPQILIGALITGGIVYAIFRAMYSPQYAGGIFTNMFWSIYNLGLLFGAIYVALEQPQYRLYPRVDKRIHCMLRLLDDSVAVGETDEISESGLSAVFEKPIPLTGKLSVKLTDWETDESTTLWVQAVRSHVDDLGKYHVGFRIIDRTDEQHQNIVKHMFGSSDSFSNYHIYTTPTSSYIGLFSSPFRLLGVKNPPTRRRTIRFNFSSPCVVETEAGHRAEGTIHDVSETGLKIMADKRISFAMEQVVRLHVCWPNGNISVVMAKIVRLEPGENNAQELGLRFVNLSREKRLEIIRQLYDHSDSLVRVAPQVQRIHYCEVVQQDGRHLRGYTQEISEVGLVVGIQDRMTLQAGEPVKIQVSWERDDVSVYQGIVKSVHRVEGRGEYLPLATIYFENVDMKTLYELNDRIHKPADPTTV